jgi:hypothetical protein
LTLLALIATIDLGNSQVAHAGDSGHPHVKISSGDTWTCSVYNNTDANASVKVTGAAKGTIGPGSASLALSGGKVMANNFTFDVGSSAMVVVQFVNSKDPGSSCLVKFTATSESTSSSMGHANASDRNNTLTLTLGSN